MEHYLYKTTTKNNVISFLGWFWVKREMWQDISCAHDSTLCQIQPSNFRIYRWRKKFSISIKNETRAFRLKWADVQQHRWEHMSLFWVNETHNHFTSRTTPTYFPYGDSWWNHQVHNKENQAFHPCSVDWRRVKNIKDRCALTKVQ